jgi:hypothetical protein
VDSGLIPCPGGRGERALANDPIGDKIDEYTTAGAAIGSHTLTSPLGDWTLTYTVSRVK